MTGSLWPTVNAMLNGTSALLLCGGWWAIRTKQVTVHVCCMVAASVVSLAFFVSYLAYHARVGSVRFEGVGWVRPVYFTTLLTHTILAVAIVPLVARTLWLGARGRFDAHKALARWTLPVWLYVCLSGIVVYWMLYRLE